MSQPRDHADRQLERSERLKELIRQLAEIEAAIRDEASDRVDAVIDPTSASWLLLRTAQEALVESESRYRRLITQTSALVFELAPDGETLFVNDAAAAITGYEPVELEGKNWLDVFFPGERRREADAFLARLADGDVAGYELALVTRAGAMTTLEVTSANRYDALGRLEAVTCIGIDVTERRLAERERDRLLELERAAREQAEEANRAKDEFLAMVSHELRTPLNAMIGWMTMLRSNRLDEATSARGLDIIDRNIQAQLQLIEDLLDVSRIVTGKFKLDVQPTQLEPVLSSALESIRPAATAKSIEIESDLDPRAGLVLGDPSRMQQVVWNLLSNAVKFTPKRGKITVRLARADSSVEISVRDTGQGIAPDFLPHVFDRFRQADGTMTRRYGGLGLGLAIVRHIVELHGGTVRARSDGEGAGCLFTVRIPIMPLRAGSLPHGVGRRAPAAAVPFDCPPTLDGIRVLVVDDEPDTRELLKVVLAECGAEVRVAGSAGEALQTLEAWTPSVIVSDIGMPGDDGYQLIAAVRGAGITVPAIALTAYARAEDRMRALTAGFEMHVAKPVEPAELLMVIDRLVRLTAKG